MAVGLCTAHARSESVRRAKSGIIILDRGPETRALEPFRSKPGAADRYAGAVNAYKSELGDSVRVYCMVVPTSAEFYCPDTARAWTSGQKEEIARIYSALRGVEPVDAYGVLSEHSSEPVYSRTDHHWSPLGAYYAAQRFAEKAGAGFRDLSHYRREVVRGYVGSMYKFSGDAAVKTAPEQFAYYVPQGVDYSTTYVGHTKAKGAKAYTATEPFAGSFFIAHKDGSGSAYCTFMGGDTRTAVVKTGAGTGRKLMVIKDSYGNALPGYLFYAFDEIHVVDFRYFTGNPAGRIRREGITDLLFANNLQHAYMASTAEAYREMLGRKE